MFSRFLRKPNAYDTKAFASVHLKKPTVDTYLNNVKPTNHWYKRTNNTVSKNKMSSHLIDALELNTGQRRRSYFGYGRTFAISDMPLYTRLCCHGSWLVTKLHLGAAQGRLHSQQLVHFQYAVCHFQTVYWVESKHFLCGNELDVMNNVISFTLFTFNSWENA